MYLRRLQLNHFKNHTKSNFTFSNNVNCFVGDNGVGKTNILDAIYYLSQSKSYFNHIDSQNIEFNNNHFFIKGVFDKDELIDEVKCSFKLGENKLLMCNNKKYKRFSDHIGKFPVIIISPTDTNLILEGSDVRRKYIDSSIAQYKKEYLKTLINYNRILKQRNSLLKQFSEKGFFDELSLEVYNEKIIELGNIIYRERINFLDHLSPVFNKYYMQISDGKENVSLIYKSQLNEDNFSNLLKQSLLKDRFSNYTQTGPHKDDIVFNLNDYQIKKIGSQGQQKSFLIALKLAQFEFIKNQLNLKPILLLDDIFDKLDDKRVLKLIDFVNKGLFGQVFITDTHKDRSENILNQANINYDIFEINKK